MFAIIQILIVKKCLSLIDESAFILIVKNQGPWQKRKGKDLDLEKINPTLVAPDLDHKKRSRDIGKIRTKDQKVFVIMKKSTLLFKKCVLVKKFDLDLKNHLNQKSL